MNIIKTMLLAFMAVLATACNDDIFVDGDGTQPERTVYIDGDNGEAVINIATKDLKTITVDDIGGQPKVWYYDKNGNEIYIGQNSLRDLAKISYRSQLAAYDIDVDGGRLTVHTIENASGSRLSADIRLEYGYTTVFVTLNIGIGKSIELTDITYDNCFNELETFQSEARHFKFHNESPLPQKVEIRPYQGYTGHAVVKPSESWAEYREVNMQLPTYANGVMEYGEEQQLKLSSAFYYKPKDWDTKELVEVPANSVVDIGTSVTFSRLATNGIMTFRLPVSGREYKTLFTTTVVEPTSYKITTQDAE